MGLIRLFFRLIRFMMITGLFLVLLIAGMAAGGFYLLDYLVTGEMVIVPNLYGKSEAEAIRILAEHNLSFTRADDLEFRADVEPGLVVSQRPTPESEVKVGRKIIIIISKGQKEQFIPDFTHRQLAEIRSDLRSAGLEIGQQAAVFHPTLPPETVISQEPLFGSRILINNKVNLLVSLGPKSSGFVMPNLVGMEMNDVRSRLQGESFDLPDEGIRYERTTDVSKWFRVIKQTPPAGSRVQESDHIHLTVGSSGLEMANLRTIHVTFPIPSELYRDSLVIVVWDDISTQFGYPSVFPVKPTLWDTTVQKTLPVIGDAMVSLCLENEDPSIPIFIPFYSQRFPSRR